jgi:hypothetical protein
LLLALLDDVERARSLATRCLQVLRERDWSGDLELVDQLEPVLEPTAARAQTLVPVPVDLEDLVDALRSNDLYGGGRLNLRTGEVFLNPPFDTFGLDPAGEDKEDDAEEDEDSSLAMEPLGSRSGYRDMQPFIAACRDARAAAQLTRAIQGKGAFRRFRITLESWPAAVFDVDGDEERAGVDHGGVVVVDGVDGAGRSRVDRWRDGCDVISGPVAGSPSAATALNASGLCARCAIRGGCRS